VGEKRFSWSKSMRASEYRLHKGDERYARVYYVNNVWVWETIGKFTGKFGEKLNIWEAKAEALKAVKLIEKARING